MSICKVLGLVDILAGVLILCAYPVWVGMPIMAVMLIKGLPSLFG